MSLSEIALLMLNLTVHKLQGFIKIEKYNQQRIHKREGLGIPLTG